MEVPTIKTKVKRSDLLPLVLEPDAVGSSPDGVEARQSNYGALSVEANPLRNFTVTPHNKIPCAREHEEKSHLKTTARAGPEGEWGEDRRVRRHEAL